ncbi:MAG: GNAT family N-acetyltransferase [Saprospiraceae bacterium]|nr:GNAT family N-acetyltransferase [Saprospiraceae bacterium]
MTTDKPPLRFERIYGAGFSAVFDDLAALRIAVFRDFPYLYEGTVDYEKEYLKTYADSPRSFLFAVYDGDRMVGATTCIPLSDETPDVQRPFLDAGYSLDQVFYFGESILLPEYRGLGLGHRFFDEREAHAAQFGGYVWTCFCAVVRPDDHPLRPDGYRPLDAFWESRGYIKEPRLQSRFSWPDLGESVSTEKTMVYWLRSIHQI